MAQKSPNTAKLTKTLVASLKPPEEGTADRKRGYRLVWDAELTGFAVRVTNNGVRTYIVRARIRNRERQQKIGSAQAPNCRAFVPFGVMCPTMMIGCT